MLRRGLARMIRGTYRGALVIAAPIAVGYVIRGPRDRGGLVVDWLTGAAFITGAAAIQWADAQLADDVVIAPSAPAAAPISS